MVAAAAAANAEKKKGKLKSAIWSAAKGAAAGPVKRYEVNIESSLFSIKKQLQSELAIRDSAIGEELAI